MPKADGQQFLTTPAVGRTGNTLLQHGHTYAAQYHADASGDPERVRATPNRETSLREVPR